MSEPTKEEIVEARKMVYKTMATYPAPKVMECWEGVGWQKDQIYFGILVGLQIAENRNARNNNNRKPSGRRSKAAK